MKLTVEVWGRPYEISVRQKSKSVWVATGDYQGHYVEVKGRTESQAIAGWREAARYRGNSGERAEARRPVTQPPAASPKLRAHAPLRAAPPNVALQATRHAGQGQRTRGHHRKQPASRSYSRAPELSR